MEKAVHSRPVSEEDEALSSRRKLKLEGKNMEEHSEEEMQQKAVECSQASECTGTYTPFIDSRYKLPHYLSEFALVEFNTNQKAGYEKVNVLETMKTLNGNEGATYIITFEASLPDDMSNNAQTFQTKLVMSLLDSTTKIDIKFVRIKLSEFDCNEEDDSKEKLSESDEEEDSEVSESDKKDSEVSESDEEDTEDMLSESDEKDTELKLSESDKKDPEQEKLSDFDEDDPKEEHRQESDDDELYSNEMNQYRIDVEKSDGFEIGNYPHVKASCCMIRRYYDPPARTQSTRNLNRLVSLCQLAICIYNMKEDTYFDNVKVVKAMAFGCGRTNYNITLEASSCDGVDVTFQTRIYASLPLPYRKIEIKFVRIKLSDNPMDITN